MWEKGNLAAVDEFTAADYVDHPIPLGLPPGPEGVKRAITTYRTAFPELKTTIDDIFAEGHRVARSAGALAARTWATGWASPDR